MMQHRHWPVWGGALVCFVLGSAFTGPNDRPVVNAPAGKIEGRLDGNLRVFKGIPYALPPVGPARWKPPAPMPRWAGVRQAADFGPACYQPTSTVRTVYTRDPLPMSEDCLTLNIWTPATARNAPVFFWIYGGALVNGASRESLYDGARLAAWSPSTIDSVSSAGSRIPSSAPNRPTESRAIMGCSTRSKRCDGYTGISHRSAATPPT